MTDDVLDFIAVPFSLGVAGVVFFAVAIYLNVRLGYKKGGVKTMGTLVCFRKFEEYVINGFRIMAGRIGYEDYNYNVRNSKPVFRFYVKGVPVEGCSEWSVGDLDRSSIGKAFPIRYFPVKNGRAYRVILEGDQYEKQRSRGRRAAFWICASIGILMTALTILVIILYFTVM